MAIFSEYPTAVTAEIVPANGNSLEASMKPLDIDLPPTLPMSFGTENSTVISAQSGSTALLPCVVHNLGDGMVRFEFGERSSETFFFSFFLSFFFFFFFGEKALPEVETLFLWQLSLPRA